MRETSRITDAIDGEVSLVRGRDLQVGDILIFFGTPHRIDHFEPYRHVIGLTGARAAVAANGWGMTISEDSDYHIMPDTGGE